MRDVYSPEKKRPNPPLHAAMFTDKNPQALKRYRYQRGLGWLSVFGSSLCFYLATVVIRWSRTTGTLDISLFVFSRFFLGFLLLALLHLRTRHLPRCKRFSFIFGRAMGNTAAVFCFYLAVDVSTVAAANILNMTYPIFVALLSWMILPGQRDRRALVTVAMAMLGIWLILDPARIHGGWHNIWGLLSGFSGGFAILFLNLSRKHDEPQTILFYVFALGSLLTLPLVHWSSHLLQPAMFGFVLLASLISILGQYLLTYGFRYVTAVEGSVISSSRILLAALLGPLLVADPALSVWGWLGALLLFTANIVLVTRRG